MPRRCPPYQLTREDLLILIEAGKTPKQAGEICGYSGCYMWHQAKKFGLKFKHGLRGVSRKSKPKFGPRSCVISRLTQMHELRWQGLPYYDIAIKLGIAESTVWRWLQDHEVKRGEVPNYRGRHYAADHRGSVDRARERGLVDA